MDTVNINGSFALHKYVITPVKLDPEGILSELFGMHTSDDWVLTVKLIRGYLLLWHWWQTLNQVYCVYCRRIQNLICHSWHKWSYHFLLWKTCSLVDYVMVICTMLLQLLNVSTHVSCSIMHVHYQLLCAQALQSCYFDDTPEKMTTAS